MKWSSGINYYKMNAQANFAEYWDLVLADVKSVHFGNETTYAIGPSSVVYYCELDDTQKVVNIVRLKYSRYDEKWTNQILAQRNPAQYPVHLLSSADFRECSTYNEAGFALQAKNPGLRLLKEYSEDEVNRMIDNLAPRHFDMVFKNKEISSVKTIRRIEDVLFRFRDIAVKFVPEQ